jgi:hypothetical protein
MTDSIEAKQLYVPELLEPNRNMDNVVRRLDLFSKPTLSPPDADKVVALAHRTIRTRLVDNGYLIEDEPVAFDMTDQEAVKIAITAARFMRAERGHAKQSEDFANRIRKGNKGE